MQIPQNMHLGDEESVYVHRNDERLQKSEEWYNKSLSELSTHVSNLCNMWRAALKQRERILSSCREHICPHVDVVTEITMEEGVMVMNGSKPTNHSDEELSRFIDLITNAIQTELPNQRYVRLSTILIPMEFTSLADNDDEQHDIIYVGGNEEVEDQIEDGNEQGQETVMTTPVDQQPNSSHRTL